MSFTVCVGLMAIWLCAAPANAYPYPAEADSFRGLRWGMKNDETLQYVGEDPETLDWIFTRSEDKMRMGDTSLTGIYYIFNFMGELYSAVVTAAGQQNHERLIRHLVQLHGEPREIEPGVRHRWNGETTRIDLYLEAANDKVTVVYTGVKVVEGALAAIDSALGALEDGAESGSGSGGLFDSLFD